MKPKHFLLAFFIVAIVGVGIWWFAQPKPTPLEKTADSKSPASGNIAAPKPAPTQIAAPITPPAAKSSTAPPDGGSEPDKGDPHAELSTAINDISSRLLSGDLYSVETNYSLPEVLAKIPPEELANLQELQTALDSSPQPVRRLQNYAQVYQTLEGQTPEMNAAGDEATYQVTPPRGMAGDPVSGSPVTLPTLTVTFQKIDGKWYIKRGPGGLSAPH